MYRSLNFTLDMLVLTAGLFLTVFASLDLYSNYQIGRFGVIATGHIIEKHEDSPGKYRQYVVTFAFMPQQSTIPITKTEIIDYHTYELLRPGSSLRVHYLSDRPDQTYINGQSPLSIWPVIIGVGIVVVSIIDIRKNYRTSDNA
jgi:hypothetical protein